MVLKEKGEYLQLLDFLLLFTVSKSSDDLLMGTSLVIDTRKGVDRRLNLIEKLLVSVYFCVTLFPEIYNDWSDISAFRQVRKLLSLIQTRVCRLDSPVTC